MQWKSGGLAALAGTLSRLPSSAMKGVVIRQGAIPAFSWRWLPAAMPARGNANLGGLSVLVCPCAPRLPSVLPG